MHPDTLFYIERTAGEKAGPYDLVQMAHMLRKKIITPETMTCIEGTDHWKPFSWQPQYSVVREIPPDAVSTRVMEEEAKALAKREPIPLPSTATVIHFAAGIVGFILLGAVAFVLSWASATLGFVLVVSGIAMMLLGTCYILMRFVDEDGWTQFKVIFYPMYEIYYLIINFWDYLPYFCLRWAGSILIVAALMGMAVGHPKEAQALKPISEKLAH